MHKLFHYVHCPYCIRVRLTLGLFDISWKSIVLPYADEQTPVSLTGKKMLPIMQFNDGSILNESLDIIKKLDERNRLNIDSWAKDHELNRWLEEVSKPLFKLVMPYLIFLPEFDKESRIYFQKKKEIKRGPFSLLVRERKKYENDVHQFLDTLPKSVSLSPKNTENISMADLMVASHLWTLYQVPEFQFTPEIHTYLQSIKESCRFDFYHEDFWKI